MRKNSFHLVIIVFALTTIWFSPVCANPDFETDIRDLENKIHHVSGRERVKSLNRLVDLYDNRSPKKAREYCALLKEEYEKLGDAEGVASIFYDWGNYLYYTGYYSRALEIYDKMRLHCEKNNLSLWLGRANVLTGRVYYRQGYYDKARSYYDKSLAIRKSINDAWGVSCSLNNIGHVYADLGDYTKAIQYQFESLKGYDKIGDKFGIGFSYENIGKTYFTLKNYDKALEFFLKSLEAYKQIDDAGFMGHALLNIGNCYRKVGESELALTHYKKGLETAEEKNLGWIIPWAIAYKSAVYNDMGIHGRAIELGLLAQALFNKIDDQTGLYLAYKSLALAYLERESPQRARDIMHDRLALAKKNHDRRVMAETYNYLGIIYTRLFNHGMALEMIEQGQILSTELKSHDLLSENKRQASILFSAMGDHQQGLMSFRQYRDIENQRASLTMKGRLLEMQTAYERERKALEQKVGQLYWILAGIAGLAAVSAVLMGFRHYRRQLAQKTATNRALQMESKLKLFQARVNPHFLFNSLDSIIQLGQEGSPKEVKQTLLKLANVYRNILAMPDLTEVTIGRELSLVQDYLEIEKQISHGRIDYDITLPKEFETCPIIPLCVLTLVENAVKHGLATQKQGGKVKVSVGLKNKTIEIRVMDNGTGFDVEKMDSGFGLYSIQKRLELYYKGLASFNIQSEKGKPTLAVIKVPYDV